MEKGVSSLLRVIVAIVLAAILLYVVLNYTLYGKKYPEMLNNTTGYTKWSGKLSEFVYGCPKREGFNVICANEERDNSNKLSLLEKVGSCPYGSCYNDPSLMNYVLDNFSSSAWLLSPNCSTLTRFEDPWKSKYDDLTVALYPKSVCSGAYCKRADKVVGQCLRLDLKGYYGESVYIGDLCYRAGAGCYFPPGFISECKDIPPSLYVFVCPDGVNCYDNGNGWEMIEGPNNGAFKSEKAFEAVKIDRDVSMIDLCPLNYQSDKSTAPHKIAWVKFTTNK